MGWPKAGEGLGLIMATNVLENMAVEAALMGDEKVGFSRGKKHRK